MTNRKITFFLMIWVFVYMVEPLLGEVEDVDFKTRTISLQAEFGLTAYKSKMFIDNDTGTNFTLGLAGRVGKEENFGVAYRTDSSTVNFQNSSNSLTTSWSDIWLSYRWGYVEFGPIIGLIEQKAADQSGELYDASGEGYGFGLNTYIPLTRRALLYFKVAGVSISTVKEKNNLAVSFGSRTDVDIGANIDLTKRKFQFLTGYRQRMYSISGPTASGAEWQGETYLGILFGVKI